MLADVRDGERKGDWLDIGEGVLCCVCGTILRDAATNERQQQPLFLSVGASSDKPLVSSTGVYYYLLGVG